MSTCTIKGFNGKKYIRMQSELRWLIYWMIIESKCLYFNGFENCFHLIDHMNFMTRVLLVLVHGRQATRVTTVIKSNFWVQLIRQCQHKLNGRKRHYDADTCTSDTKLIKNTFLFESSSFSRNTMVYKIWNHIIFQLRLTKGDLELFRQPSYVWMMLYGLNNV